MKKVISIFNRILSFLKVELEYHHWKWGTMNNVTCSRKGMKLFKENGLSSGDKIKHEKLV